MSVKTPPPPPRTTMHVKTLVEHFCDASYSVDQREAPPPLRV